MNYEKALNEINNLAKTRSLQKIVDYLYDNFNHYSWVGIYIVKGNDLILGHWKGLNATEHTKIPIGKGICGSAAATL